MMKKYAHIVLIVFALFIIAGCAAREASTGIKSEVALGDLTKANPLEVNKTDGTVSFLAQVNGKYFQEPTRHGAALANGSNGEKALLRSFADPEKLYNALTEIGATAGENMTLESTAKVKGDALDISISWLGANKPVTIQEAIQDSNDKPIDIRFGGNLKNAQDKKTGCLICLDSCPVGITSNAAYKHGAVENAKEVSFTGNQDVLPADGTYVVVTMKLKK